MAVKATRPSFSRGADGRTPSNVPEFQQRVEDLSMQTTRNLSLGDYESAQNTFYSIDATRKDQLKFRQDKEQKRQDIEKSNLGKSYSVEKARFEAEWAKKEAEIDLVCQEKMQVLDETHQIGIANLEQEIAAKVKSFRFKASVALLQLEDTERRLGLANEFKQAAEVRARAQRLRKIEEAAYEARRQEIESRPRQQLREAQEAERRFTEQKCHAMKVELKRKRDKAAAVLRQRYRNLELDMTHSFALETVAQAEIGSVKTHNSRSEQSSTFRGSLKLEALTGTKFDVPDVSRMPDIVD